MIPWLFQRQQNIYNMLLMSFIHIISNGNYMSTFIRQKLWFLRKVDLQKTDGKLTTQLYDKRDDFSFTIVNIPYICSNIPLSPAYGVYISRLIRYARTCSTYDQFLSRSRLLTDKMMLREFLQSRLMSAFCKFYGCYNDLIYNYKLSLSHMLCDIFYTNS
jgi:hypothetical protein